MIEFKNVTIAYDKHIVLKDFTLKIKEQEQIFILGPSGAGKSSFFKAFSNPQLITHGQILIDGKDLKKLSKKEMMKMRRSYGILNQETLLIESISVYDNIKLFYPCYQNKFYALFKIIRSKERGAIISILQKLGLESLIFTRVSDLSGGQKRRVEIALILLQNARIILADEPTTGLDIKNSQNIIELLEQLNQTMFINLHKLDLLAHKNKRILGFKNQKLVFDTFSKKLSKKDLARLYD